MNEFSLIDAFFKPIACPRDDVIFGIGDDAACLQVPSGMQLVISCDTLVSGVHFLPSWDAYDIACKAVMVNISDMAAMGATPCWLTLALTIPELDEAWLNRFSKGLQDSLNQFHVALIGGDTTRGPLSMTLTIHGLVPTGKAVRRSGANPGDKIYVSGELGAAALAVSLLADKNIDDGDKAVLMNKLLHPEPRVDLNQILQIFASAAIDISDGLSADLNHICEASLVGANLALDNIPIHPMVEKYKEKQAIDFALAGGDDYELCFTVSPKNEPALCASLAEIGLICYPVGVIESHIGLRGTRLGGECVALKVQGYNHF